METKTSKGKGIRIPGPDHSITISRAEGKVRERIPLGETKSESRLEILRAVWGGTKECLAF
jgi:hypothetical protein